MQEDTLVTASNSSSSMYIWDVRSTPQARHANQPLHCAVRANQPFHCAVLQLLVGEGTCAKNLLCGISTENSQLAPKGFLRFGDNHALFRRLFMVPSAWPRRSIGLVASAFIENRWRPLMPLSAPCHQLTN